MAEVLPFPWDTLQRLQAATDSPVINARTKGREEALTMLVEELAEGQVPPDAETMERRYRTLSANRAAKYRHRKQLERQAAYEQGRQPVGPDHSDELALRELAGLAASQFAPGDWELLQAIGSGKSYSEVALTLGKPIGTLKSRVSRLRCHMRNSEVGCITPRVLQEVTWRSAWRGEPAVAAYAS